MNKILSSDEAFEIIVNEYPQLKNRGLKILKQFKSSDSRKYNTFLIEISDNVYVAKGNVYDVANLVLEKHFLDLLAETGSVPKVIYPQVEPNTFLIMSYIEGKSADQELLNTEKYTRDEVFSNIGKTLRRIHSVKMESFGNPVNDDTEDYFQDLCDKLTGRLNFSKKYLTPEEYNSLLLILENHEELVRKDCAREPLITHRDVYSDNFIIEKNTREAIIIDFAMARGGRPFYDLGKFYISDISRYPECHELFLKGYGESLTNNEYRFLVIFSIILELTGQLGWFESINDKAHFERSLKFLKEISKKEGILWSLLG